MAHPTDLPIVPFASQQDWEDWLDGNCEQAPGLWLQIAKKASGIASVTYDEALEVALCFGWIDGLKKSYDERFFIQRFTPRRPRSKWSQRNVGIVERLTKQKKMRPAGLREVAAAKADGRWAAAYSGPKDAEPHPDFLAALEKSPPAKRFFESMTKRNQFMIYFRIHDAKREETRLRRIEQLVAVLREGKTPS
ncbi:MAG: YdeI/OmpD-associated family protein [Acidobacteria bacterium]|nr:YdeI/OmpD-associated family protein [Acidobacteriota bacterium]